MSKDPPPAYLAHRGVLIAIVLLVFVAFGLAVALQLTPLAQWVLAATHATQRIWYSMNWQLLPS